MTVGILSIIWVVFAIINCLWVLYYTGRIEKRKYIKFDDSLVISLMVLFGPFASFAVLFGYLWNVLENKMLIYNPFWKEK